MKKYIDLLIVHTCLLLTTNLRAQDIQYNGKQFIAISVSNTDSVSKWYEDIFKMKLLKEIKPGNNIHARIIGNQFLVVEIIQNSNSKSLPDCGLKQDESFMLKGYFKTGFYVKDLTKAEKYFRNKNVLIKHGPFDDKETNSRSIIIEDPNGFLIQVMEEIK